MNKNFSPGLLLVACAALLLGPAKPLLGQTVPMASGGNYVSGSGFYLGAHGATYGLKLTYDDTAADAVTLQANRVASWVWKNDDGTTVWPAMRLDQSNNLILYNGTSEGVVLNPVGKSLKLGTHANGTLTADANGVITAGGGFTVAGAFTNSNGSFTGGTSGLALNAGGTNQNITLNASGTGDLIFNAGGAERARIKSTGNVGIGTSTPLAKLDVRGEIWLGGSATPVLRFRDGANEYATMRVAGSDLAFEVGNSERLRIALTGNVGIGTASPGDKLEVSGAAGGNQLRITNTGNSRRTAFGHDNSGGYVQIASSGDQFSIRNTANTPFVVFDQNAGNVGIGTTAPAARLEVQGLLSGFPATSGTSQPGASLRLGNVQTNGVLDLGVNSAGGAWLQYTHQGDLSQSFPLLLNPNGGNVGVGTASTGTAKLVVAAPQSSGTNTVVGEFSKDGGSNSYGSTILRVSRTFGGNSSDLEQNSAGDGPFRWGTFGDTLLVNNQNATNGPYGSIHFVASNAVRMTIGGGTLAGNVGIGTSNPVAKLQVGEYTRIKDGNWAPPLTPGTTSAGERLVFYENPSWKTAIGMDPQNGIWFQVHTPANQVAYQWFTGVATSAPAEKMRIMENGNVGIGTTSPTHKLAVNGTIRAKEVIVDTGWADYVFDESYRLAPLSEVEAHIHAKKHLPGIPSAAEVAEHGVSMGEMQATLLSKVEELTLHLIAQQKEIAALRQELAGLKPQNHP